MSGANKLRALSKAEEPEDVDEIPALLKEVCAAQKEVAEKIAEAMTRLAGAMMAQKAPSVHVAGASVAAPSVTVKAAAPVKEIRFEIERDGFGLMTAIVAKVTRGQPQ